MAQIKKCRTNGGEVRWRVRIKRTGPDKVQHRVTETALTKAQAERRAREIENLIDEGTWRASLEASAEPTLADAIRERYLENVTPKNRGAESERYRMNAMLRNLSFADKRLSEVTGSDLARYRDDREEQVAPTTVRREMYLIKRVFDVARQEWEDCKHILRDHDPFVGLRIPKKGEPMDRRLESGEEESLLEAAATFSSPEPAVIVVLGLDTAMRSGEILKLVWGDVDLGPRPVVTARKTKNTDTRSIPLTRRAAEALRELKELRMRNGGRESVSNRERVFSYTPHGWKSVWRGAGEVRDKDTGEVKKPGYMGLRERAGSPDLRFHDLRHEATSRLVAYTQNLAVVKAITGHRSYRSLDGYTHLLTDELRGAIDGLEASRTAKGKAGSGEGDRRAVE